MKAALDLSLPAEESLKGGLWPRSRFTPSEADRFQEDGTLCHENWHENRPFGPTQIVLWMHGNLGFAKGLRIHANFYAIDCKY